MAFHLTATKKGKLNWHDLQKKCAKVDRVYVSIFPIQEVGEFDEAGIGFAVNVKDKSLDFWSEFQALLLDLMEEGFHVVELYKGEEIRQKDMKKLKKMIAKSHKRKCF